jgi:hypothetical protein
VRSSGASPTRTANYFSRVTKGKILAAVREAKGEDKAQLLDHLKTIVSAVHRVDREAGAEREQVRALLGRQSHQEVPDST